jgi:hypothetical protein
MPAFRPRTAFILLAAGLTVGACSYDRGYGYGYGVGYNSYCDPYYQDCYYGRGYGSYAYDPWWGWYGDYYYPGIGIYVFDRYGRRHRWSDDHRRYWEGRRQRWGDRDWNDRRWERWDGYRGERRDWRRGEGGRDWGDRSQRQEWNENPRSFRREGIRESVEPRVRGETRVRTESNEGRVRTDGPRTRGEGARSRGEGRGGWRGRRDD